MTEYQILSSTTPYELQQSVRIALKQGWEPLGGICVAILKLDAEQVYDAKNGKEEVVYSQAMVR